MLIGSQIVVYAGSFEGEKCYLVCSASNIEF